MNFVRMYTGKDGRSHLDDVEVKMERVTDVTQRADLLATAGPARIGIANRMMPDLHPAVMRLYIVVVEGDLDLIVGDGSRRSLGPGDVIQVEDTSGEGHRFELAPGCPRYVYFSVPIAP